MGGLVIIENRHRKDMCYDETGLRARNEDTILGSIVNITSGRAHEMIQREKLMLTLTSYNFCILTRIPKLVVLRNC